MATTKSEETVTLINQNLFFKEFTFDKNDFKIENGNTLELADNVLWLDDLLIVIQIKEKSSDTTDDASLRKWFENKILRSARKQVKSTLEYLETYDSIKIKNGQGQEYDIKEAQIRKKHCIMIYDSAPLPDDGVCNQRYYLTSDNLFIHIMSLEDYLHVCKYLFTPTELDYYLNYRKDFTIVDDYGKIIPEQFILSHFLDNPNDTTLRTDAVNKFHAVLKKIEQDNSSTIKWFIDLFQRTLKKETTDYIKIVAEIAKLNRLGLQAFNERLSHILNLKDLIGAPVDYKQFTSEKSMCSFCFVKAADKFDDNQRLNILLHHVTLYKYKRKMPKAIGVTVKKEGCYYDLDWCFLKGKWEYDAKLEQLLKEQEEIFPIKTKRVELKSHTDYYNIE